MTNRIDHTTEALKALTGIVYAADEIQNQAGFGLEAVTHALLAIAEQQKAANIIALASLRVGPNDLPVLRHLALEALGEYGVQPSAALREALGL